MSSKEKVPSWQEQSAEALSIHETYSYAYPQAHGHNRYVKKGMGAEVRAALLDQRQDEMLAFAEDQGIEPAIVFGACEAAMRLGKVPDMGTYGLGESDSWALAHFIADAILNTAHEQEEKVAMLNEALASGSAIRVEIPYSLAGEFAAAAQAARGVEKVMPHSMSRGKTVGIFVVFRNKGDAKGQAGQRVKDMAQTMGGKIMEGKAAKAKVKATMNKHMELGKTPNKARHDTERELGLGSLKVHDHGEVIAYEDMDCEECVAEAADLDSKVRSYIDQYGLKDPTRMAVALGFTPYDPKFLAAVKRAMPGKERKATDTAVRSKKPVEEEYLAQLANATEAAKPGRFSFASPFPWGDSARPADFLSQQSLIKEASKPDRLPEKSIGVGSRGPSVFLSESKPEALNESLSPVATTIAKQMGGINRLTAMLGLNWRKGYRIADLSKAAFGVPGYQGKPGLMISFPNKKSSRGNAVLVRYDNGLDAYDMAFLKVDSKGNVKIVKEFKGLYADKLVPTFEQQTGLYLRM